MLFTQFFECDVHTNICVQLHINAAFRELICAAFNDVFFQLKGGNTVGEQTAHTIITVINRYLIARAAQTVRSGHTTRTGADDTNALRQFSSG